MSLEKLSKNQISDITHVRVHPGIGVSRVGDSEEYFIGPEVMNPQHYHNSDTPLLTGNKVVTPYRDASGAIKRQAARFRVYGYNKKGEVVTEIPYEDGISEVEWTVTIANTKAQWFEFLTAMDIPEMKGSILEVRNPEITEPKLREGLAIRPKPASIGGVDVSDEKYRMKDDFDPGGKKKINVMLGEVRTDEDGRLIFLPGLGKSGTPFSEDCAPLYDPEKPKSFSNAAGWYDDVCDGSVSARVVIDGKELPVDPAWVISAPPNFAPEIISWRTMNDLMQEVYVRAGMTSLPDPVSFKDHVLPIFQRLSNLQWVNNSFASFYGIGSALDFDDNNLIAKLARKPDKQTGHDPFQEFRRTFYNSFRPVKSTGADMNSWPSIYGDAFGTNKDGEPLSTRTFLNLPGLFNYILEKWVDGEYVNDWDDNSEEYDYLDKVPLDEQPDMLDKAAMHFCIADAFHPGCELTWPTRHTSLYRAPYRIRQRKDGVPTPDYGLLITTDRVLSIGGPLYEQDPGDLTRWMALPWQGDTAYCRSGYVPDYDPYAPAYWPARVPNNVLLEDQYKTMMDDSISATDRLEAFQTRASWYHHVPRGSVDETMLWMVNHFREMGIVEKQKGPDDIPGAPQWVYVAIEDENKVVLGDALKTSTKHPDFDATLHNQTGFHSADHLKEGKDARFGRSSK